jgi:hypothetical protein
MFFLNQINSERFRKITIVGMLAAMLPVTAMAAGTFDYLGFDPESYSAAGQEGLNEIYSGRMFYTAFPLSLSKAMAAAEAEKASEYGYDPTSPEGKFFSSGGVASPPNRKNGADVDLGYTVFERDGAVLTNGNCFACHSGVVNGQVVAGLGNTNVMQRIPGAGGSNGPNMFSLMSALENDAEKKVVAGLMKSMGGGVRPVVPEITNRGDNYGPFAVWAYGAQLADPPTKGLITSSDKTELTDLIENTMSPPVNPMPWWLMKYKVRDYWYGDGAPTDAAHFSVNFTGAHDSVNDNHESHVASTAKALAFARETQSPIFPGDLNAELVQKGADLFHGRTEPADTTYFKACFECHGKYTKKSSNLDFSKPGSWDVAYEGSEELKKVRTDSAYNELVQKYRPISEHINSISEFFAKLERPDLTPRFDHLEGKGYVPPPLVGVWATAPYFHNGSVPTIHAVLNSELRPEIWSREQSGHAYDLENVGMEFDALTRVEYDSSAEKAAAAPYKSKASLDQMFIYDTTGYGRGNKGHTFGDSLTEEERAAIIEFLKSLSGPDM